MAASNSGKTDDNKPTLNKISVLLRDDEYERLDRFCRERGYKKSTLVARLIRQYLDLEGYGVPRDPNPFRAIRNAGPR
ncbi:hypothetical protein [Fontivita pretiosa]|uniref:hypothetical protein n=1 Tax=Fontivita pretiosa TaxID=2989684 RepID=UPI003D1726BE